ncbi:MAG TPA: hypothetical protein VN253_24175 [Kofleriaceae bacterium]|nr:hypothetical protein [Kofleriaceae bacterium]
MRPHFAHDADVEIHGCSEPRDRAFSEAACTRTAIAADPGSRGVPYMGRLLSIGLPAQTPAAPVRRRSPARGLAGSAAPRLVVTG